MTREIKNGKAIIDKGLTPPTSEQDLKIWLEEQANALQANEDDNIFLLAHADDGVIWGKLENGELIIAPETTFSPALRAKTLQNARLFSQSAEIYLWRDGDDNFRVRKITDGTGEEKSYFDEEQILWGDHIERDTKKYRQKDGFTLMSDSSQGLRHYVPLPIDKVEEGLQKTKRPLRLTVRNYLDDGDNGFVRVAYSRLVTLTAK